MFSALIAYAYLGLRLSALIDVSHVSWDYDLADRARQQIVAIGPAALPFLERAVQSAETAGWNVDEAYAQIGGSKAYPLLLRLSQTEGLLSPFATWALGATRDRRALPFLLQQLDTPRYRSVAAHALGDLGCEEAIPPLVALLGEGLDGFDNFAPASLGWDCAVSLSHLGEAGAKALGVALNEPASTELTRRRAARALILARAPRARLLLLQFVQGSGDEEARANAVLALAELKDQRAFPFAAKLAEKGDYQCGPGFSGLLALGDERSMAIIDKAVDASEATARSLVEALRTSTNPRAVSLLVRMLRRPEETVEQEAIWALREKADPAAVPALEQLWPKAGNSQGDIEAALARMHRRGVEAMVRIYERQDSAKRFTMLQLFGESGEDAARPILMKALNDPDAMVRDEARSALRRLFLRY